MIRPVDRRIVDGFDRREGTLSAEEMAGILAALEGDAARREAALAEARARFGVDQGVFAPDPRTFVVELNAYTPYFLDLTSFHSALPVPRRVVENDPEDWFRPGKIVSNGHFRLEAWTINRKIRLRRNETHRDAGSVTLETVDILPVENNTTALNLYLTGEADWLPTTYPPDLIDQLSKRPDFHSNQAFSTYFYRINCTKPPFSDPRVRKALCLSLDRRELVERVTRKGEPPAMTMVPPGAAGYVSPRSEIRFDPAEAKRLLAAAGFGPEGRRFPKFGILYNTHEGHKKAAEWVADQYRTHLGLDVNAYNQEWQSYLRSQTMIEYDVCRAGWVGDYVDPNTFLDLWITKGGNNNTGWGDPLYDRLVALAADPFALEPIADETIPRLKEPEEARRLLAAVTEAKDVTERIARAGALRMHLFKEAEAILFQDAFPVIPVYFYVYTNMVKPHVQGFHTMLRGPDGTRVPNLQDLHPFHRVRVRPEPAAAR